MNIYEMKRGYVLLINKLDWISNKMAELKMLGKAGEKSLINYGKLLRRYEKLLVDNYMPKTENHV